MNMKNLLITAGPTREAIDPIRFLSNRSTGEIGYELAKKAEKRGYNVTLISGPTALKRPDKIKFIVVETAKEMLIAVKKHIKKASCLIMSAAVADFRPKTSCKSKIKKGKGLNLELVKNPDILTSIKKTKIKYKVGFALESDNSIKNAKEKLKKKGLDLIIVNAITKNNDPFGKGKKEISFLSKDGTEKKYKKKDKKEIASAILDTIETNVL